MSACGRHRRGPSRQRHTHAVRPNAQSQSQYRKPERGHFTVRPSFAHDWLHSGGVSNRNPTPGRRPLPTGRMSRQAEVLGDLEPDADGPNALEKLEIQAPRSVIEAETERFIWLLHTRRLPTVHR